jgi:hypothetical protein
VESKSKDFFNDELMGKAREETENQKLTSPAYNSVPDHNEDAFQRRISAQFARKRATVVDKGFFFLFLKKCGRSLGTDSLLLAQPTGECASTQPLICHAQQVFCVDFCGVGTSSFVCMDYLLAVDAKEQYPEIYEPMQVPDPERFNRYMSLLDMQMPRTLDDPDSQRCQVDRPVHACPVAVVFFLADCTLGVEGIQIACLSWRRETLTNYDPGAAQQLACLNDHGHVHPYDGRISSFSQIFR